MTTESEPRAVCPRCWRPEVVCYCRHVEPLSTRTRVVIFQHPRERDVAINTARIAALCLPESELHVGVRWSGSNALARTLGDPERPAALLYPGPDAVDVERHPPPGPITLVVVDGTWWQARKVVRENPELAALPRYAFRPDEPSDYRIRAEPREDYVSTIEALAHVLGVLEGDPARFEAMLVPFRAMVDSQLAYAAKGENRHARHKRARPPSDPRNRLPPLLRDRGREFVCVHGEGNAWAYGAPERSEGVELLQWTAVRASTGETFQAFIAPRGPLAPATEHYVGVPSERLRAGGTLEQFLEQWARFCRPGDVFCSWGRYAEDLFTHAVGPLDYLDLRVAARLFAKTKVGAVARFLAEAGAEGPIAPMPGTNGRAAIRLSELVATLRILNA